jgi:ligand-binding sensor domain-containing protein
VHLAHYPAAVRVDGDLGDTQLVRDLLVQPSGENVAALLDDREHNIWVSTDSSLHRFSRSNVLGNMAPYCPQTPSSSR